MTVFAVAGVYFDKVYHSYDAKRNLIMRYEVAFGADNQDYQIRYKITEGLFFGEAFVIQCARIPGFYLYHHWVVI